MMIGYGIRNVKSGLLYSEREGMIDWTMDGDKTSIFNTATDAARKMALLVPMTNSQDASGWELVKLVMKAEVRGRA